MSGGPQSFAEYISPQQAYDLNKGDPKKGDMVATLSLKEWEERARVTGLCETCESNPVWRYGGTGMCFPCTTGESDASEDYELIQE